jgi:hypothetical protein
MRTYRREEAHAVDELFWERWRFRLTMGPPFTGPCSGVEMGGDDPPNDQHDHPLRIHEVLEARRSPLACVDGGWLSACQGRGQVPDT